MFRITTQHRGLETVVILDGRLDTSELDEMRQVLAVSVSEGPVELNLGGLEMCSGEGIRELRAWLDKGVRLGNATPFLRMVLTTRPHESQSHV